MHHNAVADPGFAVEGGTGAPTTDVATFRKNCTSKRKNWGRELGASPLDPPMSTFNVQLNMCPYQ